jgi:hypothetical protein
MEKILKTKKGLLLRDIALMGLLFVLILAICLSIFSVMNATYGKESITKGEMETFYNQSFIDYDLNYDNINDTSSGLSGELNPKYSNVSTTLATNTNWFTTLVDGFKGVFEVIGITIKSVFFLSNIVSETLHLILPAGIATVVSLLLQSLFVVALVWMVIGYMQRSK